MSTTVNSWAGRFLCDVSANQKLTGCDTYVFVGSEIEIEQNALVFRTVPTGKGHTFGSNSSTAGNIDVDADGEELCPRHLCTGSVRISSAAEVESDKLVADNIPPRLDVRRRLNGPRIVILDEHVSSPDTRLGIISAFINLEELDILWLLSWGLKTAHILFFNQQNIS